MQTERGVHLEWMVPENSHTHPRKGYWKFERGLKSQKQSTSRTKTGFSEVLERGGGGGEQTQKCSVEGLWIFLATVQFPPLFSSAALVVTFMDM